MTTYLFFPPPHFFFPLESPNCGGFDSAIHMLLSAGADPDLPDGDGVTPLMHAILLNQVEVSW